MKRSKSLHPLGVQNADNFAGMPGEMRELFIEEIVTFARKAQ